MQHFRLSAPLRNFFFHFPVDSSPAPHLHSKPLHDGAFFLTVNHAPRLFQ
jgi:hypothetical protein